MAKKQKISRNENRTEALRIAVSPEEKGLFSELADRKHTSLSELVRQELYRVLTFEKTQHVQR